jgi:hypothetical protein
MQTFLTTLCSLLPSKSPPEVLRRIQEAIIHLDGVTLLPRRAWCHMDLIEHFSISNNIPLRTVGRTPLQSSRWIGQMHKMPPNPTILSNGMAYNGTDHFSTFSPDITAKQRALAHHALECALNDDDLPKGWCCIRGTRRGRTTAIDTSMSETSSHSTSASSGAGTLISPISDLAHNMTSPVEEQILAPQMDRTAPHAASLPDLAWHEVRHARRATMPVQATPAKGTFSIFNKGLWGTTQQTPKQKLRKVSQKKTAVVAIALLQPAKTTMIAPRTRPQRVPALSYISQLEIGLVPEPRYIPPTTPPSPSPSTVQAQ